MIETLLEKFKISEIPIQITLDVGVKATVHAFDSDRKLHMTEEDSVLEALEKMADKLLKGDD